MEHIKLFEEFINQNIEPINEDTLLLRTLTRKSKFGFGKYADVTIGDVLKVEKDYIRWVYYTYDMISFMPDILDEVGILEEDRIAKPGKNPNKVKQSEKTKKALFAKLTDEEKLKAIKKKSHEDKQKRMNDIANQIGSQKFYKKGYLQRKNHGKI